MFALAQVVKATKVPLPPKTERVTYAPAISTPTTHRPVIVATQKPKPKVPNKIRCGKKSPWGKPVKGAKQTQLNFKPNTGECSFETYI